MFAATFSMHRCRPRPSHSPLAPLGPSCTPLDISSCVPVKSILYIPPCSRWVSFTLSVCSPMSLLVCYTVPSLMHFLPHFPNLLCAQILVVGCVLIGSVPDGVSPPFHLHVQFLLCFPLNLLRPNVIIFLRSNDMTC